MATPMELRSWLQDEVARLLEMSRADMDLDQPLTSYGLDSVAAMELAQGLSELLGREIELTNLYKYPTISELAEALSAEGLVALPP